MPTLEFALSFWPRALAVCALLAPAGLAQGGGGQTPHFVVDEATRIADPKLEGGDATLAFRVLPASSSANVTATVRQGGAVVRTLFSGNVNGGGTATVLQWDGRDSNGARCDTGAYNLRLSAPGVIAVNRTLNVVRLGVTEIEAHDSPARHDEFQMVYFLKNGEYEYYATPAIHEYATEPLDDASGEPLDPVAVHTATDEPVMDGANYATTGFNYPLAYLMGASPRLELTFGDKGTTSGGGSMLVGYPVAGHDLRVTCDPGAAVPGQDAVTPGGTALLDLPALPAEVGRTEVELTLRWQYRATGGSTWSDVPGSTTIPLRVYTLLDTPRFKAGGLGTQYAGPWVEAAEYVVGWKDILALPASDQGELTDVFVRGFFGRIGGLTEAIEGVKYNANYLCEPNCGPSHLFGFGQCRYFDIAAHEIGLAELLDAHDNGPFVNCSDCMGVSTTMLSMLGAQGVRPVHLSDPQDVIYLRVIRPIGAEVAPDDLGYTDDIWIGVFPPKVSVDHAFNYHHVFTDDDGASISDTCALVDEDGTPDALPGTPGWNVRRPWNGASGYSTLMAVNPVTQLLEDLPGIQ